MFGNLSLINQGEKMLGSDDICTHAEREAEKAESLSAFSGMKLSHIKKQVAKILAQIGRNGIFDGYTKHDISHINYMLESLTWIIPKETQDKLTSAEWAMITLSIYFHDLGMLVTKDEFNARGDSDFSIYKKAVMENKYGLEYKEKVLCLDDGEQDRFLYQEYVRSTHAERIKFWILNEASAIFPSDLTIADEIQKLIVNIDNMFKRDLAHLCESHQLDDLYDFDKYKPDQQYGATCQEIVNLHFCALVVRTTDLLHITSDRTPSIEFNLINPSDPISQQEWAKQGAVKSVRPKPQKDDDGNVDKSIQSDSIEIIALFENENGFFGLISYLNYAAIQLKENYKLNELANKKFGNNYEYPWQFIDDNSIETKNFDKKQFEFRLDQEKILDLLVGHTLYNDSSVVLRELSQNGIDAAKLMKYEYADEKVTDYKPELTINWNEAQKELEFQDNGTGMDLDIIENHLLKVGSSRYQDAEFIKKHPNFTSISRFGIGLLTCFLIADNIDIITKTRDAEKAILLKIKKIHGKYLLKYLGNSEIPDVIKKHGTIIKLNVRSEVDLTQIEKDLEKWILFPDCNVNYINDGQKRRIGYDSPAKYLEDKIKSHGFDISDNNKLKVVEMSENDITVAYAIQYVEIWKEWRFLNLKDINEEDNNSVGTCIEGIRVDFNTPGFKGQSIYSIVNCVGKGAPKTNVARSNIEITPEREKMLMSIYNLYLKHISQELDNIVEKGFSLTWAVKEVHWLLNVFFSSEYYRHRRSIEIEDKKTFNKALSLSNFILLENSDGRELCSFSDIKGKRNFWTIDCASYSSADSLVKEIKSSNASALSLLKTIFGETDSCISHIDNLLCLSSYEENISRLVFSSFQVDLIKIIPEQRRLDLRWALIDNPNWEVYNLTSDKYGRAPGKFYLQIGEVELENVGNTSALKTNDKFFLLKNSPLAELLVSITSKLEKKSNIDLLIFKHLLNFVISLFEQKKWNTDNLSDCMDIRLVRDIAGDFLSELWKIVDRDSLERAILSSDFVIFDTDLWSRRFI